MKSPVRQPHNCPFCGGSPAIVSEELTSEWKTSASLRCDSCQGKWTHEATLRVEKYPPSEVIDLTHVSMAGVAQ